jgi:hypothetical protein
MKYQVTIHKKDGGVKDGGILEISGKKALMDKGLLEHVEKNATEVGYRTENGRVFFGNASVTQEAFTRLEFTALEEKGGRTEEAEEAEEGKRKRRGS